MIEILNNVYYEKLSNETTKDYESGAARPRGLTGEASAAATKLREQESPLCMDTETGL